MNTNINLLDVVALVEDLPGAGLRRGQVGTVVELLAPDVFEVELAGRLNLVVPLSVLTSSVNLDE